MIVSPCCFAYRGGYEILQYDDKLEAVYAELEIANKPVHMLHHQLFAAGIVPVG